MGSSPISQGSSSFTAVWLVSLCSVLGFVLNRINASGLSQVWATDVFYFPAWTEFAISLGIVSGCAIVFFFIQEHFPVDPHGLKEAQEEREVGAGAEGAHGRRVRGAGGAAGATRRGEDVGSLGPRKH